MQIQALDNLLPKSLLDEDVVKEKVEDIDPKEELQDAEHYSKPDAIKEATVQQIVVETSLHGCSTIQVLQTYH